MSLSVYVATTFQPLAAASLLQSCQLPGDAVLQPAWVL